MGKHEKTLAIVCRTMPPQVVGSAVLMRNLFQTYLGRVEVISGWEHAAKIDPAFGPIGPTHTLRFWPPLLQRLMEFRLRSFHYFFAKQFVYRKLKQIRPAAVFAACTPDGILFVAAFVACRRLGIPFWGHMHDLWLENTPPGSFSRKIAERWEPQILSTADKIFCMTEAQVEYYKSRYGKQFEIIPHCVPADAATSSPPSVKTKKAGEEITILYAGNISRAMNLDAIRTFVASAAMLPANFRVKMMVSCSREHLERDGIYHPRIEYGWTSVAELQALTKKVDLLFLPLSFKNCHEEEVRTVFSTKTLDYLTSGVPIIVYGPPNSHHSRSARRHGWAHVVGEDSAGVLARAIEELAFDRGRREVIVAKAMEEAGRRNPVEWASFIESQLP